MKTLLSFLDIAPDRRHSHQGIPAFIPKACRQAGTKFLIQSTSPDWLRINFFLCYLCASAVNLILKEAMVNPKPQ
jgi:hypothetical protein